MQRENFSANVAAFMLKQLMDQRISIKGRGCMNNPKVLKKSISGDSES